MAPLHRSRAGRRWGRVGILMLVALALLLPSQALAALLPSSSSQPGAIPGEVLVTLAAPAEGPSGVLPAALQPLLEQFSIVEVTAMPGGLPAYRLRSASGADVAAMVAAFSANPVVAAAEPNVVVHLSRLPTPNDPLYQSGQQWHLDTIHAEEAWAITTGSPAMLVAVVDSGINTDHPDLAGKVAGGYNFVSERPEVVDDVGHGTMVASFITANTNDERGLAGLAPNVRLLDFKALGPNGGTSFDIARAIIAATDAGARVINGSFGSSFPSQIIQQAILYAHAKGVVVVVAAGNEGSYQLRYPAASPGVIAVGASNPQDQVALFSQRSRYVSVVAPGAGVLGADVAGHQVVANGTSLAAPIVSGLAALMLSANPSLRPDDVKRILEGTADDRDVAGFDLAAGWGRIHAGRAVAAARDGNTQPQRAAVIQGRVTGADPQRVLITVEPLGEMVQPAADGTYQLPYRGRTTYVLRATAPGHMMAGPVVVTSTGQAGEVLTVDFDFQP